MIIDDEPDSFVNVTSIYNFDDNLGEKQKLLFDFQIHYTLAPADDSDGDMEAFEDLQNRTVNTSHEFDKQWLIDGDTNDIKAIVYYILDLIEVPCYRHVVDMFTDGILNLKEELNSTTSELQRVERVKVDIDVIVWRFPGEDDDDGVRLAVAPARDEAIEQNLEAVVVENEGYCVICMDMITVGSDVPTCRMPCLHVFHRACGETWLRSSGICPLCRAVFP